MDDLECTTAAEALGYTRGDTVNVSVRVSGCYLDTINNIYVAFNVHPVGGTKSFQKPICKACS